MSEHNAESGGGVAVQRMVRHPRATYLSALCGILLTLIIIVLVFPLVVMDEMNGRHKDA